MSFIEPSRTQSCPAAVVLQTVKGETVVWTLTRLWLRELLSRKVGERGLLCSCIDDDDEAPGAVAVLPGALLPFCWHFSALKRMTLASSSKQSLRLSFRASCCCLWARSLAITIDRGIPNALGAVSRNRKEEKQMCQSVKVRLIFNHFFYAPVLINRYHDLL